MKDPNLLAKEETVTIKLKEGGNVVYQVADVELNSMSNPPILETTSILKTYSDVISVINACNSGKIFISRTDEESLKQLMRDHAGISNEVLAKVKASKLEKFTIKLSKSRMIWSTTDYDIMLSRQARILHIDLKREDLTHKQRVEIISGLNLGAIELVSDTNPIEKKKSDNDIPDISFIDLNEEYDDHLQVGDAAWKLILDQSIDKFIEVTQDGKEIMLRRLARLEKADRNRKEYIEAIAERLGVI